MAMAIENVKIKSNDLEMLLKKEHYPNDRNIVDCELHFVLESNGCQDSDCIPFTQKKLNLSHRSIHWQNDNVYVLCHIKIIIAGKICVQFFNHLLPLFHTIAIEIKWYFRLIKSILLPRALYSRWLLNVVNQCIYRILIIIKIGSCNTEI